LREVGNGHWKIDSTTHFGECSGPNPCNDEHDNCGGRKCEPADSGPNALRLVVTCPSGTTCRQDNDNAFFIDVRGQRPAWVKVCLAPGNISQAGDVLDLLPCACTTRNY
jgi:hypothetical protein